MSQHRLFYFMELKEPKAACGLFPSLSWCCYRVEWRPGLFSLVQGAFSFVAGKIIRTGGLRIDTPFATIRGTAQDRTRLPRRPESCASAP